MTIDHFNSINLCVNLHRIKFLRHQSHRQLEHYQQSLHFLIFFSLSSVGLQPVFGFLSIVLKSSKSVKSLIEEIENYAFGSHSRTRQRMQHHHHPNKPTHNHHHHFPVLRIPLIFMVYQIQCQN